MSKSQLYIFLTCMQIASSPCFQHLENISIWTKNSQAEPVRTGGNFCLGKKSSSPEQNVLLHLMVSDFRLPYKQACSVLLDSFLFLNSLQNIDTSNSISQLEVSRNLGLVQSDFDFTVAVITSKVVHSIILYSETRLRIVLTNFWRTIIQPLAHLAHRSLIFLLTFHLRKYLPC